MTSTVTISDTDTEDDGNYTCVAKLGTAKSHSKMAILDLSFEAKLLNQTNSPIRKNSTTLVHIDLSCTFEGWYYRSHTYREQK